MTQIKNLYLVNPPNPLNLKGFPGSLLSLDVWVRTHCPTTTSMILNEEDTVEINLHNSLETKLKDAPTNPYFGITCTTATYQDAIVTAKVLKQLKPSSTIILGGHHVDGQESIILGHHPEIDVVVTGEGEKPLAGILNGMREVLGVRYRNGRTLTELLAQPSKGVPLNKSELNSLDITQYNFSFPSFQFERSNLVTARGCPMECSFCAVGDQKITAQDPDVVIKQLVYLVDRNRESGKPTQISIQDNFFAQNSTRAKTIAQKIIDYSQETGVHFEWDVQTRVEQFKDENLVSLMARAGCSEAYFGVENFDPIMLNILNKAHNPQKYLRQTIQALTNCFRYGITPHLDFQVGIPSETPETEKINETALREIGTMAEHYSQTPRVFPSLSVVYPATKFFSRMTDMGVPRHIFETFTEWERKNSAYRESLYGYFAHGNGGIPLGIMDINELKKGSIDINHRELLRVKAYVDRLREISNIKVFDFSNQTLK